MTAAQSRYFPSIHDNSNASADIWSTLIHNHATLHLKLQQQQQQHRSVQRKPATVRPDWSGILVAQEYQPLEVFSPGAVGPSARWSEEDDICELDIRLKEIELVTLMGDSFDTRRCRSHECFVFVFY